METRELIGSRARLEILRALSRRDMYVTELKEAVGMDGGTAAHHLDALGDADVVAASEDGRRKDYSLVSELRVDVSPSPNRRFVVQFADAE